MAVEAELTHMVRDDGTHQVRSRRLGKITSGEGENLPLALRDLADNLEVKGG